MPSRSTVEKSMRRRAKETASASRVTYDGGNYFQEVAFDEGATVARAAPLDLYPATRDAEAVSFARLRMLFSTVDREGIGVVENGAFRNASDRAYIGPPGAGDATSLRFGLPRGATQVQPAQGFNRDTLLELAGEEGPGFTTLEAIPPGERQFAYIYRLTPRDRALALDRVLPHRTELFQLYLPAGARLEGGGGLLRDGGETQLPDGQRYRLYTAQGLAPGTRLTARLTNLPSGDGETNQLLLVAAVFALMLGVAALLVYGRRRAASPANAPAPRGLRTVPGGVTRPRERRPADPGGGAATGENLGERRQRLLLELVGLDEQYEAGALAEPEYRRRRAARKDELVGVLRQLEPRPAAGSEAAAGQRRRGR
jgi:hypothetical protein